MPKTARLECSLNEFKSQNFTKTFWKEGSPLPEDNSDSLTEKDILDNEIKLRLRQICNHLRCQMTLLEKKMPEVLEYPAYIVLKGNLREYIKNSIDASASELSIQITITDESNELFISYMDDGDGFSKKILQNKDEVSYIDIIRNNKTSLNKISITIDSDKADSNEKLGGAGAGLGLAASYLDKHKGNLVIANCRFHKGALITFNSGRRKGLSPKSFKIFCNSVDRDLSREIKSKLVPKSPGEGDSRGITFFKDENFLEKSSVVAPKPKHGLSLLKVGP